VSSPEEGIVEISDTAGDSVKIVIDEKTGLPAKEIYRTAEPMGGPVAMEEVLEDFGPAGGVKAPRKITVNQNGKKFAELAKEYTINTGIKPEVLSKQP
jgi:hypothetical protein